MKCERQGCIIPLPSWAKRETRFCSRRCAAITNNPVGRSHGPLPKQITLPAKPDGYHLLGSRIAQRRIKLDMTMVNLANLAGLSIRVIQTFEDGSRKIPLHLVEDMARALQMSAVDLLSGIFL